MFETIAGVLLVLGSGLIGREYISEEQPSLTSTLRLLDAYRDAIGLGVLITSLIGSYQCIMTACVRVYVPLYWTLWSASSLMGIMIGSALSYDFFHAHAKEPNRFHMILQWFARRGVSAASWMCWVGLTLGVWRTLNFWVS